MRTVHLDLAHSPYVILIGRNLLDHLDVLYRLLPQPRVAIVSNETVAPLYLERLEQGLREHGVQVESVVLPDGEAFKNWETLNLIFDKLLSSRCERKTTLIALGGGVIGDMTGFAAAVYQRGRAIYSDSDDFAVAGGFIGRRKNRDQSSSRQKYDRRFLPTQVSACRSCYARYAACQRVQCGDG